MNKYLKWITNYKLKIFQYYKIFNDMKLAFPELRVAYGWADIDFVGHQDWQQHKWFIVVINEEYHIIDPTIRWQKIFGYKEIETYEVRHTNT